MYGVFTASMSGLFILVSWLFFVRIRKRFFAASYCYEVVPYGDGHTPAGYVNQV